MTNPALIIPGRFNGPPGSANGGFACGAIAARLPDEFVEVTLHRPPPLDTPLAVDRAGERYEVRQPDGEVVATATAADPPATAVPHILDIPTNARPAVADSNHPFPTCFTCGPAREPDDGLRIFARRIPGHAILADRWIPGESLAGGDGSVRPEIVWAALDCPGGWAALDRIPGGVAVLGRMTTRIDRLPVTGEHCVVVAESRWHEGRKIDAHSSLYTEGGELLASARAVWIDVSGVGIRAR